MFNFGRTAPKASDPVTNSASFGNRIKQSLKNPFSKNASPQAIGKDAVSRTGVDARQLSQTSYSHEGFDPQRTHDSASSLEATSGQESADAGITHSKADKLDTAAALSEEQFNRASRVANLHHEKLRQKIAAGTDTPLDHARADHANAQAKYHYAKSLYDHNAAAVEQPASAAERIQAKRALTAKMKAGSVPHQGHIDNAKREMDAKERVYKAMLNESDGIPSKVPISNLQAAAQFYEDHAKLGIGRGIGGNGTSGVMS